ncbi:hypothetical protein PInf_007800 [Phytophthora infestans]|nr:hypothetical protein PInf_007800 [Phytophthora infestans]
MSVNPNVSTLVVLIEFGGYKSSKEVAAGGFTLSGYPDLTTEWPSANNDDVTAVGTIDLSSAVTTFTMSGGTSDVEYPQGKVASLTLTSDFISSAPEVTKVVLQNIDLSDEVASLSTLLPSTVESLDLGNTLLSAFPAEVGVLLSLQQLLLDYNYITTIDSLDVIDSIITLKFGDYKLSITADDHFSSSNSEREQRQQPYGQLRTSTGVPLGIPMSTSGAAMGSPTETPKGDASTGIPTTEVASTYQLASLDAAPLRKKPHTFLSIWSDPELLSLQVRVEDIEDVKQLGIGAFATVWLVQYRKSQLLASKRLRPERRTKKHTSNFVEEIKLIANFDHPNLVKLIGAAWTIERDLQALLEYMDGGDLRQYLSDTSTPFGWSFRKFDIAIGIIEALVYLHSFVPPLVHRDLKSKNVLLSADFQAKLSDFGTSRFRSVDNTMTAGVGTGRWLAPEVIRGDTDYGCCADIYSFGALLTELDTNQIPFSNARGSNGKVLTDMTILHRAATAQSLSLEQLTQLLLWNIPTPPRI